MDNKRVEDKIDKIAEDITEIKITLAKQHIVLVQHESRSTKLEVIVAAVQKKIAMFDGALKLIGAVAIVLSILLTAKSLLGK